MKKTVIDEAQLAQIESLQTLLKNNTSGMFGGNHRAKSFGSSCEFADYRDYAEGDDIGKIVVDSVIEAAEVEGEAEASEAPAQPTEQNQ